MKLIISPTKQMRIKNRINLWKEYLGLDEDYGYYSRED